MKEEEQDVAVNGMERENKAQGMVSVGRESEGTPITNILTFAYLTHRL